MNKQAYYSEENIDLYCGNSFNILKKLEEKSVDLIFADPPYFLSSNGMTNSGGKMVSVNKGDWDTSLTFKEKHKYNSKIILFINPYPSITLFTQADKTSP